MVGILVHNTPPVNGDYSVLYIDEDHQYALVGQPSRNDLWRYGKEQKFWGAMENVGQLQRQYVDFVTSLYREGFLDEQFIQLQKLQDEGNPDFVVEVVSLYFEDSEKLMTNLATALQQHAVDFKQVDAHVHQFKGSSSSIGAQRVKNMCVVFRDYCEEKNLDGCLKCLQQVKHEYCIVKNKLETMIRLERQILEAGGTIPMIA